MFFVLEALGEVKLLHNVVRSTYPGVEEPVIEKVW
jgi:hypothetical protein